MIPLPFTAKELVLAFSLVAPDVEARALAESITRETVDSIGWSLSLDTLILLSLVSPELNEKVEAFRRDVPQIVSADEWRVRREETRRALAESSGSTDNTR